MILCAGIVNAQVKDENIASLKEILNVDRNIEDHMVYTQSYRVRNVFREDLTAQETGMKINTTNRYIHVKSDGFEYYADSTDLYFIYHDRRFILHSSNPGFDITTMIHGADNQLDSLIMNLSDLIVTDDKDNSSERIFHLAFKEPYMGVSHMEIRYQLFDGYVSSMTYLYNDDPDQYYNMTEFYFSRPEVKSDTNPVTSIDTLFVGEDGRLLPRWKEYQYMENNETENKSQNQ